jgi:hypothetical protein
MARVETISLISDLDESVAADETVTFALDGKAFEIDLSTGQAGLLRELLTPYVAAGRRARNGASRSVKTTARPGDRQAKDAVRSWARNNGFPELADRGRIPERVLAAYATAHS